MYQISSELGPGNYRITIKCEDQSEGGVVFAEVFDTKGNQVGRIGPKALDISCSKWSVAGAIDILNLGQYKEKVSNPELYELAYFDLIKQTHDDEILPEHPL